MFGSPTRAIFTALLSLLVLGGCASFRQDVDEVLVRDPKIGAYSDPLPAQSTANSHWEYAAMSENAYQEGRASVAAKRTQFARTLEYTAEFSKEAFAAACADESKAIPLRGWQRWKFPRDLRQHQMLKEGMSLEGLEG